MARILLFGEHPDLRSLGRLHQIWAAANRETAHKICGENEIDVAILDIVLPEGGDGVSLAKRLIARYPRLQVLFIARGPKAGRVSLNAIARQMPEGSFSVLETPIVPEVIERRLREMVAREKAEKQPGTEALLERTEEAIRLAAQAEAAYRTSDRYAVALHEAAEHAHYELLQILCGLTDQDADRVEPAFTRLEESLLRLPGGYPRADNSTGSGS